VNFGDFCSQDFTEFEMPIYEYQCSMCEKTFEIFQKITEDPLKKCPDCGGDVNRLISQTSFALKGGGWYKDGYTSAGANKTKKTETKKESKPTESKKKEKTPDKK